MCITLMNFVGAYRTHEVMGVKSEHTI